MMSSTKDFDGLTIANWIRDLESSDSRLHKEAVIEKALVAANIGSLDAKCFLRNAWAAYNPFMVYNVKKVPETVGITGQANPWDDFWQLLTDLRERSLTGNRARDAIDTLSKSFDSDEWNMVCRRVLIKDLRCGITEKTLNKVLSKTDYKIPTFTCQLATDSTDRPAKMKGIKRLEVKLDGVRVLALVTNAGVTLYSRNGKPFDNFPQIAQAIEDNYRQFVNAGDMRLGNGFVLDGEIVGESFQALMKQAQRKSDVETTGMVYHIFDIIPLADFERGYWNAQQYKRIAKLESCRDALATTDCLRIMNGLDVDLSTAEGHDIMNRYAQDAVSQGFEGIMIKDVGAPYECKRSSFWMKWKPTITVDLDIVGFEEGTGRNLGRLGAIICEGTDSDRRISVNVGSGFSDTLRDEYWASRNDLLGTVVEVEADAVTQNQDGTYSLRFPRFVRFRGFEPGEKL
jgi:DNA ligase-1